MDPEETGQDTGTEEVEGTVAPETGGSDSINPAWNDLLEVVPSQLHSLVTPYLQKWDKNYQEGINKVHSQYEPYKSYIDNEIQPGQIDYALQLMQAIESRPAEVIKALQEWSGTSVEEPPTTEQQGQSGDTEIPAEWLNHPEFKRMQDMVDQMAQLMVQQNQASQVNQEDAALEAELEKLHKEHGDFDEEWVLTRAANNPNISFDKHVTAYKEFVNGIIANTRKPGPKVLSAGGVAPDSQVDTKTLDSKGRRDLVAQMLAAAAQQSQ